jgi:hypothetical protein
MVATARKIGVSIIAAHHPDPIPRIERHGEPDEAAACDGRASDPAPHRDLTDEGRGLALRDRPQREVRTTKRRSRLAAGRAPPLASRPGMSLPGING